MRFVIPRVELLALMGKVQAVVATKPVLPVLANVLIEAVDNQLILSTTDLMVSMRAYVSAQVEKEGAVTLPAKRFFQLVRELTASHIDIETINEESVQITSGGSQFTMTGIRKEEFPQFPDLRDGIVRSMSNALLKELLMNSSFAAARDDNRQVLNGVFLEQQSGVITCVGTNGKRLARVWADVEGKEGATGAYILPLKAVEELVTFLEDKQASVLVSFLPDKVGFETGNGILITKLLMGQYPDFKRVMPKRVDHPVRLHREELVSLLRQISLFTDDHSAPVQCLLSEGELRLHAIKGEMGTGSVRMAVDYIGPSLNIAFNPYYFLDVLRHTKDEIVEFHVASSHLPTLVTDSSKAEFVLMPMRIGKASAL